MKLSTRDMIFCAIFAGITAVFAQIIIPLPFTAVPITMQTFAVVLSGVVLGAKNGFISQVIFILIGLIGIPVFAGFGSGFGTIFGPTGGYALGFPIMSFITGYFSHYFNKKLYIITGAIIGLMIDYTLGTIMFSLIMNMSILKSLTLCVIPFILFDLCKVVAASIIGLKVSKTIKLWYV